jgi:hypothetical protein
VDLSGCVREAVVSIGVRPRPRRALRIAPYPTGLLIGIGAVTVVVSTMVAAAIPPAATGWRLGVVALTVGGFAALVPDGWAVASTGGLAWLLANGFLVDRFGELSWHGWSDLYRSLTFVSVATAGLAIGQGARLWSAWRRRLRFDDEWRSFPTMSVSSRSLDEKETRDA